MLLLILGGEISRPTLTRRIGSTVPNMRHCSARAVHETVVMHRDLMPHTMLWNAEMSGHR